jgi:hypothetical protein
MRGTKPRPDYGKKKNKCMKTRILHNSNWNQQFIILYTKKIQPLATKATNTIFYHPVI